LYDWVREKNGVYHLTSAGEASRYDWAQKIWELAPNRDMLKLKEIQRANSADFPTPAERPMYTALDCGKIKQSCRTNVSNWIKQQINNLEV
jgi:dTDP-4-dehydrorhamnose reductase